MSQLSDYRKRISKLLAAEDIQSTLEAEGVGSVLASRIAGSSGVRAIRSLVAENDEKDRERNADPKNIKES